jgi:hypothetical protein
MAHYGGGDWSSLSNDEELGHVDEGGEHSGLCGTTGQQGFLGNN